MNSKFSIYTVLLIIILFLASFLRLYKISDYMTFLGDEGRDVLIVKSILEGNFTLLGPRSSAADFFYGPIYYYFITPFLWLFNYDPVGPAVLVALFGIATVFLVYWIGKELLSPTAGIFAAALYAVPPLIIGYSRSSWNPNLLPFFSFLALYSTYKAVRSSSWKRFIFSGVLLGICFQLQYLATFLALIIAAFTFIGTLYINKRFDLMLFIKRYLQLFIGFLLGWSLFLGFELRHGFPNIKTIVSFILYQNPEKIYVNNTTVFSIVSDVFFRLFGRLVTRFPPSEQINLSQNLDLRIWEILTLVLAFAAIFALFRIKHKLQMIFFAIWLFAGVGLFGLYKKPIYDYYFGFMFPLPFLLIGNLLSHLYTNVSIRWLGKIVSIGIFLFLFIFNLYGAPFRYAPNRQKEQVKQIAHFVLSKTDNKPFNFALLTLGNSDHAYRYFFKLAGRDPIEIKNKQNDPKRKTVTDQLLIVCEETNCKPLGHPLWEVAGFGRAEILGKWDVSVVQVYKLAHYKGK